MSIRNSFHTHTVFSDGDNTPREMIEAAVRLGMEQICITDHSYTFFDESYCLRKDEIAIYMDRVLRLQEEFKDRINVKVGVEQDYYSQEPTGSYEYVVGSVHYVKVSKEAQCIGTASGEAVADLYIPVDDSPKTAAKLLMDTAQNYFGGDIYALLEEYFRTVGDVVEKTNADLIGHLDVISKCNTLYPIFDPKHPRYKAAWKAACDKLLKTGRPFEVNVSPLLRGIKPEPYPSDEIRQYLSEHGGRMILTGDCHSTAALEQFAQLSEEDFI